MSKHGNHPFELVEKGVKGTHRILHKDILLEFPTCSSYGRWEGHFFWEDHWVHDRALSFVSSHLYDLSSLGNRTIFGFQGRFENYVSISFRVGRRDACTWEYKS